MSTIIWNGSCIAADSRAIGGYIQQQPMDKIFHFDDTGYTFAFCGVYKAGYNIMRWVNSGSDLEKKPDIGESDGFSILWIGGPNGPMVAERSLLWIPASAPFAMGSGDHLALGAYEADPDIVKSVKIAAMYDQHSDDRVVVFNLLNNKWVDFDD